MVICDTSEQRLLEAKTTYPYAEITNDLERVLRHPKVDAIALATPAASHPALAAQALGSGKHVLVEKPLALNSRACDQLIEAAEKSDLVLMVGHTFRYNVAVRWIRKYLDEGRLGNVLYFYTQRLDLGKIRQDVNVMWNLAPHDVSILTYLAGEDPEAVTAHGRAFLQPGMEDVVFLVLEFPSRVLGHIHVGSLDPQKVRSVTVVGTKTMVVYDGISADTRLRIYDKGVDVVNDHRDATHGSGKYRELRLKLRSGDLWCLRIDFREPLRVECEEFVSAIVEQPTPLTDGREGRRVVAILEAAQQSMQLGAQRVPVVAP